MSDPTSHDLTDDATQAAIDDADTQAAIAAEDEQNLDYARRDIKMADDHIAAAQAVEELRDALILIDHACKLTAFAWPAYDLRTLPNYGGDEPHDGIVYSWDTDSKLALNDDLEWRVMPRADSEVELELGQAE